ncbi:MAG: sigma-70 family RNA polymerase sigma factor [Verrucomicrobiota bacterium]
MPDSDHERHIQFTRHFAESERAMQAFAFSLAPNRADADDIIQETLKALWEKFDDYDPERPFLPWANRFVYRQVLMHRRSTAIRHKYVFTDETFEQLANAEPTTPEHDQAKEVALEKCLAKLSRKQREIVEKRYASKGSLQDLAEETGSSANALYKTLQRVREALYQCINKRLAQEGFNA